MRRIDRLLEAVAALDEIENELDSIVPSQAETGAESVETKKTRKNFETRVLESAVNNSKSDPKYSQIMSQIFQATNASSSLDSVPVVVPLSCNLQQTTGDAIEAAMRKIFGDDLTNRSQGKKRIDVIFSGVDIEVKYSRNGFNSLATDSQALRKRTDKWYMYVKGEVGINTPCDNQIWLMRSDHLYNEMFIERKIDDTSINTSLDISTQKRKKITSLAQIRADIRKIEVDLRNAIWNKATGDDLPVRSMGLERRVGLNRVRFDLKFE